MPKKKKSKHFSTIVPINSKEELQKVLTLQRTISDASVQEVQQHMHLPPKYFVETASKVLEVYARYATLTEFHKMPQLADSEKWGATFGVTALVGSLVLDHARKMIDVQSDLRLEYLRFLDNLAMPGNGSIDMNALHRVFAILSENYGILWSISEQLSLTVTGKRVYLHLLDAAKFVEEAAAAVRKFK